MPENTPHHPRQDEAVRRRLAEARHTAPLPAEVASRLDATLAGLVAERATTGPAPGAVVPLRRRRWPAVLAAAAAVTALGFALPTLTGDSGTDQQAAGDAATAESAPGPWSRATLAELGYTKVRELPLVVDLQVLRDAPLAEGYAGHLELDGGRKPLDDEVSEPRNDRGRTSENDLRHRNTATWAQACGPVAPAPGVRLFTARSGGHRVVIAKGEPTADGVLVEVHECSSQDPATPTETFTLPPAE